MLHKTTPSHHCHHSHSWLNQAPIESNGTIKAWAAGLPEGAHGNRPLLLTNYVTEDKASGQASVWQDDLDRELGASLGTYMDDEVIDDDLKH